MLNSKFCEGSPPVLQINDIRYEIFDTVMKYLYKGSTDELCIDSSDILELMAAANFFQLDGLLHYCEIRWVSVYLIILSYHHLSYQVCWTHQPGDHRVLLHPCQGDHTVAIMIWCRNLMWLLGLLCQTPAGFLWRVYSAKSCRLAHLRWFHQKTNIREKIPKSRCYNRYEDW